MTRDNIKLSLAKIIGQVAPDADLSIVESDEDLREQLDIDSMDFLNIMVGIKDTLGIDVPEDDYSQIETLDALLSYLEQRAD